MTLEVLYGILKTYEPEMIKRKSLRACQGHIVDGSSALFVNDIQSSDNELEIQTPVVSSNEQKNKEPQKQVILELEEDEFYPWMNWISWINPWLTYGYKTGSVDRSKIRCFNYDELGHFATECRKPKKVKKDKAYLELEANQYKETVEKMSIKMFHIHTSMVEATEETVKQENEYLKNKLKSASEIEVVLRERIENNEVKLKSFRNAASRLVGQYHEKNKPCENIAIVLDYDALNNNKKVEGDRSKTIIDEYVPVMLRKVYAPLFKACEANFSEVELVIKQELVDEDNEKKCTKTTPTPKAEKSPCKPGVGACKYNEAKAYDPYSLCDKFDCIPCNMKVMKSCNKLRIDIKEVNIESSSKKENAHQSMNSILSESLNSTSTKSVNKKKLPNTA
ncbi:hypothetical protein AgCh_008119 [Apium graveolens]